MSNITISSLHHYSNRFLRSTDLSRDFNDPNGMEGYWLTDFGKHCLSRLSEGLEPNSSRRAWRLTGDFGSGKSSFALLLANAFRDSKSRLPKLLREQVLEQVPQVKRLQYIPVLVVGNREAVAPAVLRAFHKVLGELFPRGAKSALELAIDRVLREGRSRDHEIIELIHRANAKIVQSGKGNGTLLILDEVGKFLEFAALNPEEQDVYFLQQLAEAAARSGKFPLMVVCLLHQGFNAYSEQLAQGTQREWEKIAGRFDEIIFQQPLDQVALLISSALNVEIEDIPSSLKRESKRLLEKALELGWYGTSASRETLRHLRYRLFPLDPMLLPILVRTFQRFGQNERSLFSFLCSHEPFGLRAFSNGPLKNGARLYQLSDFYDYIRASFGHKLAVAGYRTHWNVIESVIEARNTDSPLELRVLKSAGVLGLLNTQDFLPTEDSIAWAAGGASESERSNVGSFLKKLTKARVLHFRGTVRGYSLWPYTSVDIEGRIQEAKRAIPKVSRLAQCITEQIDVRPIVARAHYIRTGNLRYFDVVYCMPGDLQDTVSTYRTRADGAVFICMCETLAEHNEAKSVARNIKVGNDKIIRVIAIPRPLSHLQHAVLDAQRWEWVQTNTLELNNDRFAREEVQLHLQEARNRLQSQVQEYMGIRRISGRSTLVWYYKGKEEFLLTGRRILSWLSELCDEIFEHAPIIKNELLNRQSLSSAATAARMRLLELMFASADKLDLGFLPDRKPPEKSMYLSVLRKTGLHHQRNGIWRIGLPQESDTSHVAPVINKIREVISNRPDVRVPIQDLMDVLRHPPYGLRDGLFPIFLAVVAIADEQEIAFYEDGTFLREVGKDSFLRMIKAPNRFDIQYCKVEGVRSELFDSLVKALGLRKSREKNIEILDVVRALCQFVAQLPEYARNTRRLSSNALKVRSVILDAREPVRMVFHDLPEACDFEEFEIGKSVSVKQAQLFVRKLKDAIDELRAAFPNLRQRMEKGLAKEFGYGKRSKPQYRQKLTIRGEKLLVHVAENKLKAFTFRLVDRELLEADWLDSIGSLLALRPPSKWKDEDEDVFDRELGILSARFKRTEAVAFAAAAGGKAKSGIRIAVTRADGSERQEVLHIYDDENERLNQLQDQIAAIISGDTRLGLAAASQAIWALLKPVEESV